jgi:dihydrofolate reductase
MIISLITAMDRNRLIGTNNQLPWHLPADFAWFKQVTMGKPIVMGRKTYDSIGRPLPGRTNIVLSRDASLVIDGVECVPDLEAAKQAAGDVAELMIIGGSSIYELALPQVDRLYITHVDGEFEGDAWFPAIDTQQWRKISSEQRLADAANACACEFAVYEKV